MALRQSRGVDQKRRMVRMATRTTLSKANIGNTTTIKDAAGGSTSRKSRAMPGMPSKFAKCFEQEITSLQEAQSMTEARLFTLLPSTRTQFPLTVAYAITVHKSQGATLDCAVVDISCRHFTPGRSYVAVSRVKTLHGIMFDAPSDHQPLRGQVTPATNACAIDAIFRQALIICRRMQMRLISWRFLSRGWLHLGWQLRLVA
ncbi:hypothetical protein E4U58_005460 [Claviceps cyperi]|nr:hypothetical protein E4U58_005460 [Claviceps cyperi]